MAAAEERMTVSDQSPTVDDESDGGGGGATQALSKNAQKKLMKQQRFEAKKAEKKAAAKEQKKREVDRKRKEWEEMLGRMTEEERSRLIESRKLMRKERMEKRSEERESKIRRLTQAQLEGAQNIVIDLEFSHLMTASEIHSLVQQIMYCYAVNGRCSSPGHLWLTGYQGEMEMQLRRLPGFDKWIIEKDKRPYIEAFRDRKDHLVYLTADSDNILNELDLTKIYVVGGLVDRNRWKGITMKKAQEQGIQTAKLPIGNYLKMSSSQVLTVNQVIEIILKYLETKDWISSFFQVIPQRKRCEAVAASDEVGGGILQKEDEEVEGEVEEDDNENVDQLERKRKCFESPSKE